MLIPMAVLALTGLGLAAYQLTRGPSPVKVAAGLGLNPAYVVAAMKWASKRGLPLDWVLATILVESSGNWKAVGDGGKSVGLMQVNTSAWAATMAGRGVTREMLFQPETNIEWGTEIMRDFRDKILAILGGRTPPAPLDVIVRLAYKGPATVYAALKRGQNPVNISWAPDAVRNWQAAMARVRPLTRPSLLVA